MGFSGLWISHSSLGEMFLRHIPMPLIVMHNASVTCCSAFDPVIAFNGMALFPISAQLIANTNMTHNPTIADPSILFIRNLLGEKLAYIHLRDSCRVGLPEQGALAFPTHPIPFDSLTSCTPGRGDGLLAKSRKANEEGEDELEADESQNTIKHESSSTVQPHCSCSPHEEKGL